MGSRLLIVDDESDMLDFLERVFRRDYDVARATSVDEAERLLSSGPVDVLITDRRMPRRSGVELLEIAQRLCPRAVRVLLTGYADSVNELGRLNSVADAWVTKPVDSRALKQAVDEARARKDAGSAAR